MFELYWHFLVKVPMMGADAFTLIVGGLKHLLLKI